MVVFDRPLGAPADVKELEYVSGLHQTAPVVRIDGSIQAEDIQLYLKSRFGIEVELNVVTNTILQGMGGSADDGEVIDLMEMTAILLIPHLVKAARLLQGQELPPDVQRPSPHTLKHVCQMMLHDLNVNKEEDDDEEEDHECDYNKTPPLTVALIQRIFRAYGEGDLAADETLCQEMLNMTAGHQVFDAAALAQALTADVKLYNLDNERRYASLYQDIFDHGGDDDNDGKHNANNNDDEEEKAQGEKLDNEDGEDQFTLLKHTYTAPAIDSTAGTYRSKTLLICLWASTLFSYFSAPPTPDIQDSTCKAYIIGGTWKDNASTMSCETGNAILFWLNLFFTLCVWGMLWVGCGSIGNQQDGIRWWKPTCGSLFMFLVVVMGFVGSNFSTEEDAEGESQVVREDFSADQRYVRVVALILGCIVIVFHLLHTIEICTSKDRRRKTILIEHAFSHEVDHKAAMHFKINKMVDNAVLIHHTDDKQNIVKTCFGHALHVYSKWNKTEKAGGLVWAWKQLLSGKIFREEGIWYSARLIAANVSQYIVCLYILLAGIYYIYYVKDELDEEDAKAILRNEAERIIWSEADPEKVDTYSAVVASFLGAFMNNMTTVGLLTANCDGVVNTGSDIVDGACSEFLGCTFSNDSQAQTDTFCALMSMENLTPEEQLTLLDGAGLNANLIIDKMRGAMETAINDSVDSLYPSEDYMMVAPLVIGVAVAMLTSLFLAVSYLPSITSTTLQLRTGVFPTLADFQKMNQYRAAPDTVTMLTGSLFWGCLFAGVIVGGIVGSVAFLFLWQGSIYFVQRAVAIVIGIVIIALIRIGLMCYGRQRYFQSFYRKKPAAANFYFLAMEWANFALTAGFVFVRLIKLLLVAGLSVGRIDTRFLAKGVGELGPLELDPFPTIHMRDIMSHEAHRHPYIEVLGSIYLMKLRYGRRFCSNAGSCWRLLFVYALMPWMQRYRIFDAPGVKQLDEDGNVILRDDQVSEQLRELNLAAEDGQLRSSFAVAPRLLASAAGGGSTRRDANSSKKNSKDETILRLRSENEELKKTIARLEESIHRSSIENDCGSVWNK